MITQDWLPDVRDQGSQLRQQILKKRQTIYTYDGTIFNLL